jgi:hypothetical protein
MGFTTMGRSLIVVASIGFTTMGGSLIVGGASMGFTAMSGSLTVGASMGSTTMGGSLIVCVTVDDLLKSQWFERVVYKSCKKSYSTCSYNVKHKQLLISYL